MLTARNAIGQREAPPDHRHGDIRATGQNVMILPPAVQQNGIAVARNGPKGLGITARTHIHRKTVPAVRDGDNRWGGVRDRRQRAGWNRCKRGKRTGQDHA